MTTAERVRECGCPPWAEPCVHYGGGQVWIASFDGEGHWVHGPSTIDNPDELDDPDMRTHRQPCGCPHFTDEAEARDEFDRRAAQLLGRDA